ncbi:MAG: hypothetical protein K0R39_2136 [Symbiobacteriaceae bacterium]|jgi:hypothetical protein|nr:hypothetical protein [Symbiobacteriaceae bacterium]
MRTSAHVGRRLLAALTLAITLITGSFSAQAADNGIRVRLNGQLLSVDVITQNGFSMVPVRAVSEMLGATVKWNEATQSVSIQRGSVSILLPLGSYSAAVNNKKVDLDVPAQLIGTLTYVPLRFIADSFGVRIAWDGSLNTIYIGSGDPRTFVGRVSAGENHTLGIDADGNVLAWGANDIGQLGDRGTDPRTVATPVMGLHDVVAVAAGGNQSLAVKEDGTVWTWGDTAVPSVDTTLPVQVPGMTGVTALAAGPDHAVALRYDGTVWVWGKAVDDVLLATSGVRSKPFQIPGLENVAAVAAGPNFDVALKADGTVWTWGRNPNGQLGDGSKVSRSQPVLVDGITDVTAISTGCGQTLALRKDGTVWAWGVGANGELGNGNTMDLTRPEKVKNLTGVMAIAAGCRHSVALKADGTVWAWGATDLGQLGTVSAKPRLLPAQVDKIHGIKHLAAGLGHSVVVRHDGSFVTWGNNAEGQLASGSYAAKTTPVDVVVRRELPDTYQGNRLTWNQADVEEGLNGLSGYSPSGKHTFSVDLETSWQGLASAMLVTNMDQDIAIRTGEPMVAVRAGQQYTLTVNAKARAQAGRLWALRVFWYDKDGKYLEKFAQAPRMETSPVWTELTLTARAPEGAAFAYMEVIMYNARVEEALWWDEASFR